MEGMKKMPLAKSMAVGPQASVPGDMLVSGGPVMAVSNPKGMAPKSLGGGCQLVQGPIEPKVGK